MATNDKKGPSNKFGPKIPTSAPGSADAQYAEESSYPRRVVTFKSKEGLTRFNKPRIIFGSMISSDIRLDQDSVAPIHAVIEIQEMLTGGAAQATLFDLASDTGVSVNGKKIVTHVLNAGDKIRIGKTEQEFVFGFEEANSNNKKEDAIVGSGQRLYFDPNEDRKALILQSEEGVEDIFDYRTTSKTALEVVMSWRGTVLNVEHFVSDRNVTVGDSQNSDFGIPPLLSPGKYALVTRTADGFVLNVDTHMTGVIQNRGDLKNINDLKKQHEDGRIPLTKNDFAKISFGEVDFYLSYTPAPPRLKSRKLFEKDPLFFKVFWLSLLFNSFLIFILTQIQIPESIEAEKLPERIATVLYQPEKYTYPVRKQREFEEQTKKPRSTTTIKPTATPTPRKTVKLDITPSQTPPKPQAQINTGQSTSQSSKDGDKNQKQGSAGQSQSKEGQGAKAQGATGERGTKSGREDKTKQYYAERPSAQGGSGQGGGQSQVNGPGNLDVLKGTSQKFLSLLGGSTQQLGKSGNKLKGYGAFNTQGGGGQALSGSGAGGGGQSTTSAGLSDQGQGGGRVGTGLGAVGKGDNIVGGEVRVELRRGGPEESVIMGAIDRDAVEAALLAHKDEFRLCYEQEINQGSPNIAGRVTTSFVIGTAGRVTKSGIASTSLRNPNTERCILKVIQRIQFPTPMGGGVVQVKYPFKFRPVER